MKQYAALDDTIYFWFAANDTSGSGGDGATPAADVRLAGAAADTAPVHSPTPILLSHANYPAGAYEVAIAATSGNGFAANNTYAVFCTLAIDSQNPTGFVGSFDLKPIKANIIQIGDTAQSATDLKDFADTGYDPSAHRTQAQVKALDVSAIDAIHDDVFEGTLTFRQIQRIMLSALAEKSTGGGGTSLKFRDHADTKDRISVTVDSQNNRTAVTLDGS